MTYYDKIITRWVWRRRRERDGRRGHRVRSVNRRFFVAGRREHGRRVQVRIQARDDWARRRNLLQGVRGQRQGKVEPGNDVGAVWAWQEIEVELEVEFRGRLWTVAWREVVGRSAAWNDVHHLQEKSKVKYVSFSQELFGVSFYERYDDFLAEVFVA